MTREKYWKFLAHLFTRYECDLLNNIDQLSKKPCQGIPLLNACYESELETLREAMDEHKLFMNQVESATDLCEILREQIAMNKWSTPVLLAHIEHWTSTCKRKEPELRI